MTQKKRKKLKWIKHYNNKQKLLLVGEGDFSFSACLAAAFGSATNMVATTLDSKHSLITKHRQSEINLEILKSKGCLVLYGVNVYDMNKHPTLSQMKFDIIIFNFPHAGFFHPFCENDSKVIKRHQKIVKAFFRSAKEMLNEEGELHVTHRDDQPYNRWNLKELAEDSGLVLKEKAKFLTEDYPGYQNKRGSGSKCNKTFSLKDSAYTFKFSLEKNFTRSNQEIMDLYNRLTTGELIENGCGSKHDQQRRNNGGVLDFLEISNGWLGFDSQSVLNLLVLCNRLFVIVGWRPAVVAIITYFLFFFFLFLTLF